MAKVKIQGNASGTGVLTVTAPNTSTDRTITLPDSTGTLLTADGDGSNLTGISAGPFTQVSTHKFTYTTTLNPMIQVIDSTNTVKAQMQGGNVSAVFGSASDHPVDFIQGAGEATRMRLNTSGVLSVPNGIELGSGIDATAANTLDDYEEGSFTPVFTGSSGSTGSYNTGEHEARYTKIGRLVVIQFKLTLTNKGSWGGEVRFTALPFSVSDTMPATGSVTLAYVDIPGDASNHNVYVTSGVTYWRVQYTTDNNTTSMVLLSETANNASFSGTFSYTTND